MKACLRCLASQAIQCLPPPWCSPKADLPARECACGVPEPFAVLATVCHLQCSVPEPASSTFSKDTSPVLGPCTTAFAHPSVTLPLTHSHISLLPVHAFAFAPHSLPPSPRAPLVRRAPPSSLAPPLVHRHKHPHQRDGYRAAADPGGGGGGTRVARLRDGAVRGVLSGEHPPARDLRQKPSAPCTFSAPSAPPTLLHAACFRA